MLRRSVLITMTAILVLGTVLLPKSADATTETITGGLLRNEWRYYDTRRTVSYSPWEIAFKKTDGPAIDLLYFGCGPSAGAGSGPAIYFANPDPTGWQWLRAGKAWGITYCLAAKSYGSELTDTFSGPLDWDGGY